MHQPTPAVPLPSPGELWPSLAGLHPADAAQAARAADLMDLWQSRRAWPRVLTELLDLDLPTLAAFYCRLEREAPPLPWGLRPDSGWMRSGSFSFVNIRALGRGQRFGTFLDGARVVPGLRVRAIHLAPFMPYEHGCVYAPSAIRTIATQVTDLELERRGFGRELQLAAFVRACHLLGKAVGFDLEPHVSSFALPVLEHPWLFRWIKLDDAKTDLAHGSMDRVLEEATQDHIASEVAALVGRRKAEAGLATLEYANEGERRVREPLHHRLIGELIQAGYWTIPSQIWSGDGVPQFNRMHPDGYPIFHCRNRAGVDCREQALNVVTPFRYDRRPDLFADVFPWWRDRFGFDFARFDSVDHIFDSCDDAGRPRSDRPGPADLARVLAHLRQGHPGLGLLAERMGNEIAEYGATGFDLLLGDDMFLPMGRGLVEKTWKLGEDIARLAEPDGRAVSVCWAVDTHDTGDPNLLGSPLVQSLGSAGLVQRLFLSRFGSAGRGLRPAYEVVGVQDRSHGLYRSNVSDENLVFSDDRRHCEAYHGLMDAHEACLPILQVGAIRDTGCDGNGAHWTVASPAGTIFCAMAFESGDGYGLAGMAFAPGTARTWRHPRPEAGPAQPGSRLEPGECLVAWA